MSADKRPEWKDATSYSRNDRERVPRTFDVTAGPVRLVVTCGHIACPGEWVMHGYGLNIDTEPLGLDAAEPAGKAMEEAERVALIKATRLLRAVQAIRDARGEDA